MTSAANLAQQLTGHLLLNRLMIARDNDNNDYSYNDIQNGYLLCAVFAPLNDDENSNSNNDDNMSVFNELDWSLQEI